MTGTDTGCGKTAVAAAICRAARDAGVGVSVLKPIETGCEEREGELRPADALELAAAAGDDAPVERLCPYRLRLAAAPEVAAADEGVAIDLARIEAACRQAAARAELLVVEGAGGLLVPIVPQVDMAALALRLDLPVLVVARASLGTINHTLLTLEAAAARGLRVVGVAISHTEPELSPATRRNLGWLRAHLPVPEIGELPHGADRLVPPLDPRELLERIRRS